MSRVLSSAILATLLQAGLSAAPLRADTVGLYGTPGLIDMPTGQALPDGAIALSYGQYGSASRMTFHMQITPRLSGTFRYSIIDDLDAPGRTRYDRSFDIHYQFWEEGQLRPALSVGLRDIGGTGVYSSEYLAATKTFGRLTATLGLGWGRLAGRDGFRNPLAILSDRFEDRPQAFGGVTGEFDAESWFRGDAAFFGGLTYDIGDRTRLVLEYSSDIYAKENRFGTADRQDSPVNVGLSHQFDWGLNASAYYMYGSDVGVLLSYQLDPKTPFVPGGRDPLAPPLVPPAGDHAASWQNVALSVPATGAPQPTHARAVLAPQLLEQGMTLTAFEQTGHTAQVVIENSRWRSPVQALGRAARIMANVLPEGITDFTVTFAENGLPLTSVTLARADLAELEFDVEGAWRMRARSQVTDALPRPDAPRPDAYPAFDYDITPYVATALFDPESPVRYDLGAQLTASYEPRAGLIFSGQLRYPFVSTIDDATRFSNSAIEPVRSNSFRYARESDLEINHLTAEYFFRPAPDTFGRVTAGYLENMFGGVSSEVLWAPMGQRLALGAEVNYAMQRDFDMMFGFQDYSVVTGHASAYYDLGGGFHGQLDLGRYLAGDWGGTVTLARRFDTGIEIGTFATFTEVSKEDFGEGSFDKGIFFEIPMSFFTGTASRETVSRVIRPVSRDGGARLNVRNRLYDVTHPYRNGALQQDWGVFFQ
ncbi:YjbH domain-containing protein [Thalassorhabdomicrobium marinisediminis]|uniref:YjbH domain-containing protein n=1 Tax=Thalassorhabdomicrobium marinisediminis TaxID=2170577 RepID=UPI002491EEE4|nr:YjbH domain-containing protein [Thalassorhabdomicrobium marinisediminis]